MAVKISGQNVRAIAQGLIGLADLLEQKDQLQLEVAELLASRDKITTDLAAAQEAAKSEQTAIAGDVAKMKQQQGNTVKAHEKRIVDLVAQEQPLKDRLVELRRNIEAEVATAAQRHSEMMAQYESEMQVLRATREALKAEVDGYRSRLTSLHADLGKVAAR